MANLKFYRKAVAPTEGLVQGAIWFNTSDRTIQLYTGSAWEKYTGIIDATYTNNILTITKSVGDPLTLNFSDVAQKSVLDELITNFGTLESNVNTNTGDINTLKTTVGEHTTALGTVDSRIAAAVKEESDRAKGVEGGLADRVGSLETDNTSNKAAIQALQTAVGEGGSVDTKIANAIDALGGEATGDGTHVDVKVVTENGEVKSVEVTESDIASAEALADEIATARAAEKANADNIATEKGRVDTLIGTDTDKSVRTIATEVLAAELIPEGAAESLNTLQEIAAWIQDHPEDASQMNERIGDLETLAGGNKTAIEGIQAAYVKSVTDSADYIEVTTADGVVTIADAALKTELERLAGLIADNAEDIQEVNNKAGVTSFQGATGAVTVDTEGTANGSVKFAMANNKLSGTVTGLQDAAYATVASLNTTAQGYATTAEANAKSHAETKASEAQTAATTAANSYTDTAITNAFVWAEF